MNTHPASAAEKEILILSLKELIDNVAVAASRYLLLGEIQIATLLLI